MTNPKEGFVMIGSSAGSWALLTWPFTVTEGREAQGSWTQPQTCSKIGNVSRWKREWEEERDMALIEL